MLLKKINRFSTKLVPERLVNLEDEEGSYLDLKILLGEEATAEREAASQAPTIQAISEVMRSVRADIRKEDETSGHNVFLLDKLETPKSEQETQIPTSEQETQIPRSRQDKKIDKSEEEWTLDPELEWLNEEGETTTIVGANISEKRKELSKIFGGLKRLNLVQGDERNILGDRYRFTDKKESFRSDDIGIPIASGGSCRVYRVEDKYTGRKLMLKVAIKGTDISHQELFLNEAKIIELVGGNNIVEIEESGILEYVDPLTGQKTSRPYILMPEYRHDLRNDSEKVKEMSSLEKLFFLRRVGVGLGRAIEQAHKAGVIHHDLKPGNIFVDKRGEVVLADFGIAQNLATEEVRSGIFGTLDFMSPEQLVDESADEKSDYYGLAATMFTLLTGATVLAKTELIIRFDRLKKLKIKDPKIYTKHIRRLNNLLKQNGIYPHCTAFLIKLLSGSPEERGEDFLAGLVEALHKDYRHIEETESEETRIKLSHMLNEAVKRDDLVSLAAPKVRSAESLNEIKDRFKEHLTEGDIDKIDRIRKKLIELEGRHDEGERELMHNYTHVTNILFKLIYTTPTQRDRIFETNIEKDIEKLGGEIAELKLEEVGATA